MHDEITIHDLTAVAEREHILLDVREPWEFSVGHVPGARNVPLSALVQTEPSLPHDAEIIVICQVGGRSAQAAAWLAQTGRTVHSVAGGTQAWMDAGHPVVIGTES